MPRRTGVSRYQPIVEHRRAQSSGEVALTFA
jgi:hypothetical protein